MSKISASEREQIRVAAEDAYGPFGAEYVVKLIEGSPDLDLAEIVDKTMAALSSNEEFLEAVVAINTARRARQNAPATTGAPRREFKSLVKVLNLGTDGTK